MFGVLNSMFTVQSHGDGKIPVPSVGVWWSDPRA